MSDLIDRQDAIKTAHLPTIEDAGYEVIRLDDILILPSAQPEQRWIPCSERLPDHNQVCIVTDETGRGTYEYGFHDETYDEEKGWTYLGHKIIAWMPLPESYRGEHDGQTD